MTVTKEDIIRLLDASPLEIENFVRKQVREEMSRRIELQYRLDLIARRNAEQRAKRFLIAARHRSGDTPGRHLKIAVAKRQFEKRCQKRASLIYDCFVQQEVRECLRGHDDMD